MLELLTGGAMALLVWIIMIALMILFIVGNCKMIAKTGEPAWKGIIPFYEDYLKCKYCGHISLFISRLGWSIAMFIFPLIISTALTAIFKYSAYKYMIIPGLFTLGIGIWLFWLNINFAIHVANAWGGNKWKAIAFATSGPIAVVITGFDKTPYVGEDYDNPEIMSLTDVKDYLLASDTDTEVEVTTQVRTASSKDDGLRRL